MQSDPMEMVDRAKLGKTQQKIDFWYVFLDTCTLEYMYIIVLRDTCALTSHLRVDYFAIFCIINNSLSMHASIYCILSLEFPYVLVMIYVFYKLINYATEIYIITSKVTRCILYLMWYLFSYIYCIDQVTWNHCVMQA